MNFNSIIFICFLISVVVVNYLLPQRLRLYFLLTSSLFFIGYWNIESLLAVIVFSVINFYLARSLHKSSVLYALGLIINIFAIILFNYFSGTKSGFDFHYSVISFNINSFIIALGLSFYSLQNISYLTEIYFRRMYPISGLSNFVLYNSFFPRIMSGPVMTPAEFMPQVDNSVILKEDIVCGSQRFLLGLFKKMVLADRIAPAVHSIFDYGDSYPGLTTLAGVYLFTIQLYFDFSGYTDMALGAAKMLGYDLKENFDLPLRSTSLSQFWRRWHISLISWFTNYIYYPVVYKLRDHKKKAAFVGILLTFLVSGIWHGIGLTFLAWAFCHIIYLSFELFTKNRRSQLAEKFNSKIFDLVCIILVFNAVCFSNIFFRSYSMERAGSIISNLFSRFLPSDFLGDFLAPLAVGGHQADLFNFYISISFVSLFLLFERKISRFATEKKFNVVYVSIIVLLIMIFGIFNAGERFIYMQF